MRKLDGEGEDHDEPYRRASSVLSHHDHQTNEDHADYRHHTPEPVQLGKGDHHHQVHQHDDQRSHDQATAGTLQHLSSDHNRVPSISPSTSH
jgi:hypothetical protein